MSLIYKSAPKPKFSMYNFILGASIPPALITNIFTLPFEPTMVMAASIFFPISALYSWHVIRMRGSARLVDVTEAYLYDSGT